MPHPLYDTQLNQLDIAVFDLETTGLYPSLDRIIQIALVLISQGQIEGDANHREWKVNPGEDYLPLEDIVHDLTGISDDELREAPAINLVLAEFGEAVGRRVVAGHNVQQFDLPFVRRAESRLGIDVQTDYYIDTLKLARKIRPQQPGHTLAQCAGAYGIDFDENELHDALVDTRVCARLLLRQIDDLAERGIHTFGEMIGLLS